MDVADNRLSSRIHPGAVEERALADNAQHFKTRLSQTAGLSDSAISAAWPDWWSDAADASPSAVAELRFSVARKLGLDPRSLLEAEQPRFVWDDSAKYKHFTGDAERERPAITAFGTSVGRMLVKATPAFVPIEGLEAEGLRRSILSNKPFIGLVDLLAFLWGIGVPVIHLRVFPLVAKRMCAMAVRVQTRYAILLAKDSQYPASIAFHLAHEIGHIALGHIDQNSALVDMEDPNEAAGDKDEEEVAADRFALHLLTGNPHFRVGKDGEGNSAKQLASQALTIGPQNGIEPGMLALCYGHETAEWDVVQSALTRIYSSPLPAWSVTNSIANKQLSWEELGDENASFIHAVMGGV